MKNEVIVACKTEGASRGEVHTGFWWGNQLEKLCIDVNGIVELDVQQTGVRNVIGVAQKTEELLFWKKIRRRAVSCCVRIVAILWLGLLFLDGIIRN